MSLLLRVLTRRHDRTEQARRAYEHSVAQRAEVAETVALLREAAERLSATTAEVRAETGRLREEAR